MIEQDLREGLRYALAGEPSPVFNPDAVIARARRERKRRRTLLTAGVATAVVLGGAVSVPIALSRESVRPAAGPSAAPLPPGARQQLNFAWPPSDVTAVHYTAEQLRARGAQLRDHLRARFPQVVLAASQVTVGAFGGRSGGAVADGEGYLESLATFNVNGAKSGVSLRLYAPGAQAPKPTGQCATGAVLQCDVIHLPDGSSLVLETVNVGKNLTGGVIATVTHYRTTGAVVSASAYDYDPSTSGRIIYQPTVSVPNQQLATLVTDPALGL